MQPDDIQARPPDMNIHSLDIDEVYRTLVSAPDGLSGQEAARRLSEYGPNEIKAARKKPLYLRFVAQFTHFLAVLLWVAAAMCVVSELIRPGEGMLLLAVAIVGVIFVNAVFTFVQEYRAEKSVEALRKLLPFNVKVLRGGTVNEVRSEEVAPGDVILLAEGDKVPADARLVESDRLTVNNAPLTGESDPRPRTETPSDGEYLDSPNIVFAGTLVLGGSGRAVVYATGMSTEFGRIAHLTGSVEPGLSPLQKEIIRATRIIAVIAVTTGAFFFGIGLAMGRGFWHNFLFAVGIIIANVPEGLLPTVTLALAMGSQRMARKNALIKTLTSVETLGSVTVICTDKTGTLTENRMEVKDVWTPGGDRGMLMAAAMLCNNAVYQDGRYRGDPTETALLKAAMSEAGVPQARRVFDVPFDPEKKRMLTVHELDGGRFVFVKGALETVLPLCDRVAASGGPSPLGGPEEESARAAAGGMMDGGLRVIAFAYRPLAPDAGIDESGAGLEAGLIFAGLAGLEDPPRDGVAEAVAKCRSAGIRVIMLTGDASRTAVSIARQAGLATGEPAVVEGSAMERMTDAELRERLEASEVIFSRMTPRHKMRVVSVLKDEGERVAVTGDGVNDAPALKKADIGVAMGLAGTDVAREAADVVLLDDNFATIVSAVEEGRAIFDNIRKFITYIFAHLTPEAVPYVMFALFRLPLPLTVMQILAIDLGTETVPALALGVERPEPNIMQRLPRRGAELIDMPLLVRGYVFLGLVSAAGVLFAFFYVLYGGGWSWGVVLPEGSLLARKASTAAFLGIVVMQVGNVFACRSSDEPVMKLGLFSNRMVLAGIAVELVLSAAIIYHPWGNKIFGTAPVGVDVWLVLLPFSAALFFADELWKRIKLSRASRAPS